REIVKIAPEGVDQAALTTCCRLEEFEASIGYVGGKIERDYNISAGKFVMKTPFFNFAQSRRYLGRAVEIDPSSWEAWANIATLSLLEGNTAQGKAERDKATALKGSPVNPLDRQKTPYLYEGPPPPAK